MKLDIQNGVLLKCEVMPHETGLMLPEEVTAIGDQAFARCRNLKSLYVPKHLKSIGTLAFWDCEALEHLMTNNTQSGFCLPEGLEEIGENAFAGCKQMKSFYFPSTVTKLGDFAMSDCDNLRKITARNPDGSIADFPIWHYAAKSFRTSHYLDMVFGRYDKAETMEELFLIVSRITTGYDDGSALEWLASNRWAFDKILFRNNSLVHTVRANTRYAKLIVNTTPTLRDRLLALFQIERVVEIVPDAFLESLYQFAVEEKDYLLQYNLRRRMEDYEDTVEEDKKFNPFLDIIKDHNNRKRENPHKKTKAEKSLIERRCELWDGDV